MSNFTEAAPDRHLALARPSFLSRRLIAGVDSARLVYGATAVYAVVFAGAAVLRYVSFNAGRFDLGNMAQPLWSTAHGEFLSMTAVTGEQINRFGVHVEPLLALLTPLWLLWPSPVALAVLQAVVVPLGALPVYWLARKHLSSGRRAACFALAYLLLPAVQWNAHYDFHAQSLALPLVLFAIWYLDEDRFLAFLPFAIAAAAAKEHMPLLVGWLGVWYALRHGRVRRGAAVAAAGLVWTVVNLAVVQPRYAADGLDLFASRYAHLGGSPLGVLRTTLTDPLLVAGELLTRDDIGFVFVLLGPLCALWLLEPVLAVAAVPQLALCLLSNRPEQTSIAHQYSAAIVPFVLAAAILGAARLSPARRSRWAAVVVAAAAVTAVASPLWFVRLYVDDLRSPADAARGHAVALVPSDAPVSATNMLGGHLSERERIFSFPRRAEAEWVLVDRSDPAIGDGVDERTFERALRWMERDRRFTRVYSAVGIDVYRRTQGGR